jgi:hypothetical protein
MFHIFELRKFQNKFQLDCTQSKKSLDNPKLTNFYYRVNALSLLFCKKNLQGHFFFIFLWIFFSLKNTEYYNSCTLQQVYHTKLEPENKIHCHTNQTTCMLPTHAQPYHKGNSQTNTHKKQPNRKQRNRNFVIHSLLTHSTGSDAPISTKFDIHWFVTEFPFPPSHDSWTNLPTNGL